MTPRRRLGLGDSFFSSRTLYRSSRCQSFFLHALRSHERGKFIRKVFQEFRRLYRREATNSAARLDAPRLTLSVPLNEFLICETHRFRTRQLPRRWRNASRRRDGVVSLNGRRNEVKGVKCWKLGLKSRVPRYEAVSKGTGSRRTLSRLRNCSLSSNPVFETRLTNYSKIILFYASNHLFNYKFDHWNLLANYAVSSRR